jgi:hypothetical protein
MSQHLHRLKSMPKPDGIMASQNFGQVAVECETRHGGPVSPPYGAISTRPIRVVDMDIGKVETGLQQRVCLCHSAVKNADGDGLWTCRSDSLNEIIR